MARDNLPWRSVTWAEYCQWLQGKTVDKESCGGCAAVILEFTCGARAMLLSESIGGYSSQTPMEMEPPSVQVLDGGKPPKVTPPVPYRGGL